MELPETVVNQRRAGSASPDEAPLVLLLDLPILSIPVKTLLTYSTFAYLAPVVTRPNSCRAMVVIRPPFSGPIPFHDPDLFLEVLVHGEL